MMRRIGRYVLAALGSCAAVVGLGIVYLWRVEIQQIPAAIPLWVSVPLVWLLVGFAVAPFVGKLLRGRDRLISVNYGPYVVDGTPVVHARFIAWAGQIRPGDRIRDELTGDVLEWTGSGWTNLGPEGLAK